MEDNMIYGQNCQDANPAPVSHEIKKPLRPIIVGILLVFLSLALLILSFCPIVTQYIMIEDEKQTLDIGDSALEHIILMFDSFKSREDIDPALKQEMNDCLEELYELYENKGDEDPEDFADEYSDLTVELYKLTQRMKYQSKEYATTFSDVFAGISGILYLLLTLALLVFSSLHLVFILIQKKPRFFRTALILLCCLPAVLLMLYYFARFRYHGTLTNYTMSPTVILSLVLSLVAIAGFTVLRAVKAFHLKSTVFASVGVISSAIVIVMLFLPVFSSTYEGYFSQESQEQTVSLSLDATLYEQAMQSEFMDDMKALAQADKIERHDKLNNMLNSFFNYRIKDIKQGALDDDNYEFAATLLSSDGKTSLSFAVVFYFLLFLTAGAVCSFNLIWLSIGLFPKKTVLIAKILCALFALGILIMAIVTAVLIQGTIDQHTFTRYSFTVGIGTIFTFLFALLVPFVPNKREGILAEKNPPEEAPETEPTVTQ
ncbi:MAG: hypothetical protein IKM34_06260 [Clostridia bacterium]|nr:hypothetical protein [Clostridia bacterium]